jgi:hypothetical protein
VAMEKKLSMGPIARIPTPPACPISTCVYVGMSFEKARHGMALHMVYVYVTYLFIVYPSVINVVKGILDDLDHFK